MNQQPAEKRICDEHGLLDVHSIFSTIQGEGPFAGKPSIFVRLAGCNLQCPQCDTDYTYGRHTMSPDEVIKAIQAFQNHRGMQPDPLIVITGGEPFRQDIFCLVRDLLSYGYTIQVETNGTLPPPNIAFFELCSLDISEKNKCFVVCSPKTGSVHISMEPIICAYKYVVTADEIDNADGMPLRVLGHPGTRVARPHSKYKGEIYIQPADTHEVPQNAINLDRSIDVCMRFGYRLNIQIHKVIGVE